MSRAAGWGWFVGWSLVGAAYVVGVLGVLTMGLFVMPLAIIGTVLLVRSAPSRRAVAGLIGGPAWILSFLAIRDHGTSPVCSGTFGGGTCAYQPWNRWPLVAGAIASVVIAGALFLVTRGRVQAHDEEVKARWVAYLATLPPPPPESSTKE